MAGRKSKLDKVQKHIIAALKTGATDKDVCAHAGIHPDTFYDWLKRGEAEPDSPYSEFSDAVTRARIAAKVTAIGSLHTAMIGVRTVRRTRHVVNETRLNQWGSPFDYHIDEEDEIVVEAPGDWRAAVEYLKRRFPAEWGDKQSNFNYNNLDPALIEKLFKSLDAAGLNASDVFNELIASAASEATGPTGGQEHTGKV